MSSTIVRTDPAMTAYRQLRLHDQPDAAMITDATRALAIGPRPADSRRLGTTDFHRLRIGN